MFLSKIVCQVPTVALAQVVQPPPPSPCNLSVSTESFLEVASVEALLDGGGESGGGLVSEGGEGCGSF
ncbi:tocopherol O-methyltransferase [Pyrus ussuriensis x Pyrus communis]|uniref:Tocopherol O-methyltransferase n=1 Tax=Pyrus ussuriensis x Pyrus communis TaxID=2448454 RepID=A0A5N5FSJ2_9ROSA|nr:tocopherol O-methyltransferase [Pyrus ussuriensis x Pyrus communis]